MANKHESREPGTKPAIWVRSEPDMVRFYAGPARPGTNKWVGLGQKTRHGGIKTLDLRWPHGHYKCWFESIFTLHLTLIYAYT
jgi:hypothetical protein